MLNVRVSWLWLIPLILVVTWIGARGLNADALWFDEYWSVYNAGGAQYGPLSPGEVWEQVAAGDPWQAPGYFLLLAGWGALVGWTPFALRALSLMAGVLAVAWAYRLGRDLVSPIGGLAAAVMMGFSAYFLYYFHELRTYTLILMLITLTAWAYWRVQNGGGRWTQTALFFGSLCLMYTHYFAALTVLVLGLYHLLFVHKDRRWWRVTLLMGAAGILFLPWLGVLITGVNSAVEDTLRQASAWTPRQAVSGLLFMFSNGGVILALVLLGASFLTLTRPAYSSKIAVGEGLKPSPTNAPYRLFGSLQSVTLFAWFWLLAMLGLLLVVNARFGVILEARYLFPLWPPLALVSAIAVYRIAQTGARPLVWLVLGFWIAAGVWNSVDSDSANTLSNPHWHQPWNALVDELRPRVQEGDALVYLLPDWTWPSYHQPVFDHYLYGLPVRGRLMQRPENVGAEAFNQGVNDAVEGVDRVWLAYTADQPTGYTDDVRGLLGDQSYIPCGQVGTAPQLDLELYTRRHTPPVRYGEIVTNSLLESAYLPASDTLNITAVWSPDANAATDPYSVGLHVKDSAGQLVAQADYGLPPEAEACQTVDIDVSSLTPGDYTVDAVVYNWQTGERLPALGTGDTPQDEASVGQFTIP